MQLTTRIHGLDGTLEALKQLPEAMQKQVVSGALRAGGNLLKAEIRDRAPAHDLVDVLGRDSHAKRIARYGTLKGNIRVTRARGNPFLFHVHIGRAFWGRWIEFGTADRYHKKTGKYVGKVTPQPFMRPAFDARREAVVRKVAEAMATGMNRQVRRLAGLSRKA